MPENKTANPVTFWCWKCQQAVAADVKIVPSYGPEVHFAGCPKCGTLNKVNK